MENYSKMTIITVKLLHWNSIPFLTQIRKGEFVFLYARCCPLAVILLDAILLREIWLHGFEISHGKWLHDELTWLSGLFSNMLPLKFNLPWDTNHLPLRLNDLPSFFIYFFPFPCLQSCCGTLCSSSSKFVCVQPGPSFVCCNFWL